MTDAARAWGSHLLAERADGSLGRRRGRANGVWDTTSSLLHIPVPLCQSLDLGSSGTSLPAGILCSGPQQVLGRPQNLECCTLLVPCLGGLASAPAGQA